MLCLCLTVAVALAVSKHEIKRYTATASIAFNNNQLNQEIAGLSASNSGTAAQQTSDLELIHAGSVAERTAQVIGDGLTARMVETSLDIFQESESNITSVSATASSPELATKIANTYAREFVKEQGESNSRFFSSALAVVTKQLRRLTPSQRVGSDGLSLQNRAQSLTLLRALPPNSFQVAQEALQPLAPSSPRLSRNVAIGALLGFFIGLGLALILERLDLRIRNPKEFEAIYNQPVLGLLSNNPSLDELRSQTRSNTPESLANVQPEAFQAIRAHLRSFNAERELRTVLVTSATSGEGKSVVALHLASAAARMGARVLLLEADLRRPTLSRRLGLQNEIGLSDVLYRHMADATAIQSVNSTIGGIHSGALDVMPAGVSPINPVELIDSQAMADLLVRARDQYDFVVIDASELHAFADGFLLLSKVDGAILAGWIGRSRRDEAVHLKQVLETSGAPMVGVVVSGAFSRRGEPARLVAGRPEPDASDSAKQGLAQPAHPQGTS